MSTASHPRLMTAEEFMDADLGEGVHELVRGKVVESPPSHFEHGVVCGRVAGLFWEYQRRTSYGHGASNNTLVKTEQNPDTVRGVDFMFFSKARWPKPSETAKLPPIAPDVAIEVASPSYRRGDLLKKASEYLAAGSLAVWLVYPKKRSVAIFRDSQTPPVVLTGGDVIEEQPELPGFRCTVAELFP